MPARMRILIVHAHHDPLSFNHAMTREAVSALEGAGRECIVSDLYAMRFDPVSDRRNFICAVNPDRLRQQDEEAYASRTNGYAPELQAEMNKLAWCDVLIFQFPIWWLGMPAIMKGWIDKVFAIGRAYGGGRWFDGGVLKNKRAMLSLTVGGPAAVYSGAGVYGEINALLHPIHRGIFQFTGLGVIEPFVVYAPSRMDASTRAAALARYRQRVLNLNTAPLIPAPDMAEFDGLIRKKATA
jgi:NAD(P)H dehydrogenase (quinone)